MTSRFCLWQLFNSRNGDRNSVDNKIIIMTDGGSNMDQENTIPAAENLKDEDEADAEIFVVAVGDRVSEPSANCVGPSMVAYPLI